MRTTLKSREVLEQSCDHLVLPCFNFPDRSESLVELTQLSCGMFYSQTRESIFSVARVFDPQLPVDSVDYAVQLLRAPKRLWPRMGDFISTR